MVFPPDESTSRHWFVTLWPTARLMRRLYQYGAFAGVRVAHRHDGAWLFRQHVLIVVGPERGVRQFDRVTRRAISRKRRGGQGTDLLRFLEALDAQAPTGTSGGR